MTRLFHGSGVHLDSGTVLRPRGEAYEADWAASDFYGPLERWRPAGCRPHREAVFMVEDIDDLDAAGAVTDFCAEVEPSGEVSRHDMEWGSRISCLLSEGASPEDDEVRDCALRYWAGEAHPDGPMWEYLAEAATVIRCEPWETFDLDAPSP
jgi:hypothetical protein